MTDTSVRERLARTAAIKAWDGDHPIPYRFSWDGADDEFRQHWLEMIDAILAELAEPSDGMVDAACRTIDGIYAALDDQVTMALRGAIQHIRGGGS